MAQATARAKARKSVGNYFKKRARKSSGLFHWVWMLLALGVGGGGFLGYDKIKWIWETGNKVAARVQQHRQGQQAGTGSVRVYFTNPEQSSDIVQALTSHIDATKQSLDVCAFELDNKLIVEALVRAVRRGVSVRLVTETNYLDESGVHALRAEGVPVVDDQRIGSLMHNKFIVFDHAAVWTGSMNFTENCAYRNNNHGLYFDDGNLAANYATKFQWMFEQHKFGGAPSRADHIPNPQVTLADGTRVENYFSTHDGVAGHVMEAVSRSKKSIHFLAFSFTHDGIGKTMLERARAGVEVSGVFEKTQTSGGYSEYGKFISAQLPVYLDGNPRNMHHKAIVIDGEVVIAGSFNFSDSADKSNDENLVIIHNPDVARKFEQEFQKVLSVARGAGVVTQAPVSQEHGWLGGR